MLSYHQSSFSLFFCLQIFGFLATIVFSLDFYLIFNELATFLKEGGQTEAEPSRQRGNSPNQTGISRNIQNRSNKDRFVLPTPQMPSQSVSQSVAGVTGDPRTLLSCGSKWSGHFISQTFWCCGWWVDEAMQYIRGLHHKRYIQLH